MSSFLDGDMKAQNIIKFPKSLWAKVGGKAATKVVKDSDKGKGYKKDFKAYKTHTPFWFTKKLSGGKTVRVFAEDYPTRKAAGRAAPKGVSASRQVSPPNLRLTSTMLNSISAQKPTETGVDIVYRDGLKVGYNAKMGRDIYGISKDNEKRITDELSDYIGKQIGKYARDSINITIG